MQLRGFVAFVVTSLSLWLTAGCGQPCACPETPSQPGEPDSKPRRPSMPALPPMGQCTDTPVDVGLELEKVDGLGVVTLSADAFVQLSPKHRMMAYHLSRAAVAGDPIVYAQRSRFGIKLKVVAEELALHRSAVPEALRAKVETFVRRVFVHKGVYDTWTGQKMGLPFDEATFKRVLLAVAKDGAELPGGGDEAAVSGLVTTLGPLLFDPAFEPASRTSTTAALPGPYGPWVEPMLASLKEAAKLAEGKQKTSIEQLADYLGSGDAAAYARHARAEEQSAPVATRMGFFSSRLAGPELWAGVMLEDASLQATMAALAPALAHLRAVALPSEPNVVSLPPRAGIPLTMTGRAAPAMSIVSQLQGPRGPAQTWVWAPVLDAEVKLRVLALKKGFIPDPARAADFERCAPHVYRMLAILPAAIGAQSSSGSNALPPEERAAIEQARVQAAAMVASWDPKMIEAGLLPDSTCAGIVDALVPADFLARLGSLGEGALRDPDFRASSLIVGHALAQGALREVTRGGHVHLSIVEPERWRASVKSLLDALVQIETKGDRDGARKLLERYAQAVAPRWRQSARARADEAGLPARLVFVTPRLKAIRDADGAITDATILDSLNVIETALIDAGKMEMP